MKVSPWLIGLSVLLAFAIFILDVFVPVGIAAAVPYIGLILLARRSHWPPFAVVLASLTTVLVVLGYLVSPGEADKSALINRGVTLFVIWLTAMLCYQQTEAAQKLARARRELEQQLVKTVAESSQVSAALTNEKESRSDAEERLDAVEPLYFALFNQTYQLIAVLNPAGRIKEANDTFLAVGDYSRDAIKAKALAELEIWDEATDTRPALDNAVEEAARGDFVRLEVPLKDVSGNVLIMDVSIKPIRDPDSEIAQLIFEARDVTELKSKQEALNQAQKIELTGRLTSGVAHDFNNILAVIAGHLEIAEKLSSRDDKMADRISQALAAVFRGKELTEQLLTLSRKRVLEIGPTNANAVIHEAARMLDRTLLGECEIDLELDGDVWTAMADPTQLQTAIMNLVINASDAMPDGGRVRIRSDSVAFESAVDAARYRLAPGNYVAISVIDQGVGMSEDEIERATEPFFTTKQPGSGTGLGLSMVEEFVRECDGALHIASTPGIGTTITLYFPRSLETIEAEAPTAESDAAEGTRGARVLVVEDNEELRKNVVHSLSEAGHQVEQAADGVTALSILRSKPSFDLLFTDLSLPGEIDGRELADKACRLIPDLSVLLTSGVPDEVERYSLTSATYELLAKPYRREDLARAVQRALPGR